MKIFLEIFVFLAIFITCYAEDLKEIAHFGSKIIYAVITPEAVTGAEAKTACNRHGLTQVASESNWENTSIATFLRKRAESGENIVHGWLGGNNESSDGAWYWSSTRKNLGPYINWAEGEPKKGPNNNCMAISPNGKWSVNYCDNPQGLAICEKMH